MDFQYILPSAPCAPIMENLEAHLLTQKFYQEVTYREEFQAYCQWYKETAQQNQRELKKMRGDLNIFSWFLG
jgi:hypothetical protein